jgi:hypothetical protein
MRNITKAAAAGVACTAAVGTVLALGSGSATASSSSWAGGGVPSANPRVGVQNNVLAPGLAAEPVAWGALGLTNPDTAAGVTHYGYDTANGGPLTQDQKEAFKTEPDKNVYLTFAGHHYLYQGHEGGPQGYVTRVDLDEPDPAKRVALMADTDASGAKLPTFDGITWNPFTRQLMMTAEAKAPNGGVWALTLDGDGMPATGTAIRLPALGSGGYEGIQNDSAGNVWLVEDIGGASVGGGKKPNSYVYRFVPSDTTDLTRGGTLQALQVHRHDGSPITAADLTADPSSRDIADLHDPRRSFATTWVDTHSGSAAFDATASAAAAGATPFKRPENGVFRPGTRFGEFYFTETGDTSTKSTLPGAYGGVFRISQSSPSADTGRLAIVAVGDEDHTGLDNIAFAGPDDLLVVEDAGDSLHQQRNALDSGFRVDLRGEREGEHQRGARFTRWLAEGRDASALYDATTSPGYNDGDNEITGIHVSDGDPTVAGLLGAKTPRPFDGSWRVFWTQQHGDNVTWEVSSSGRRGDRD